MSRPTNDPRCIFCGAKANSREHAIPKWIAKRFGLRGVFLQQIATNMTPERQNISVASFRRRIFCSDCNRHFKHLEDAVIPVLEPMGRGEQRTLSRDHQQTLALWGIKTTLAILAASKIEPSEFVPEAHRARVRLDGIPPDDSWVGFCPWHGPVALYAGVLPWEFEDSDRPLGGDAYGVMFSFGGVIMKVVGFPKTPPEPLRPGGHGDNIIAVWPPAEQVDEREWPPYGGLAWDLRSYTTLFDIVPIIVS